MTDVTNINKGQSRGLTRITWFIAGLIFSAVMLYSVPATGPLATGAVGSVVSNAPVVAEKVTSTVSGWIDGAGTE